MVIFPMSEQEQPIEIIETSSLETADRIRERLAQWNRQMTPDQLEEWIAARREKYPQEFDADGRHMSAAEMNPRDTKTEVRVLPDAPAEPALPIPAVTPAPRLAIPQGNVADLLEHQIAICAAIIGNVGEFIAGEVRPESCYPFMDRIARLMSSSAKAGRAIGQLRGIPAETRQTHVKERNREREGASI